MKYKDLFHICNNNLKLKHDNLYITTFPGEIPPGGFHKNLLLVVIFFILSIGFIMCSGVISVEEEEVIEKEDSPFVLTATGKTPQYNMETIGIPAVIVPFDYPVPDGMIENDVEKQQMIRAKINHIKELNKLYWGGKPSRSREEMKFVFEEMWHTINETFPGFEGLDTDWDEFYNTYRVKIDNIESYGDYAHIMTKMAYVLEEGHSQVIPGRLLGNKGFNSYLNRAPVFIPSKTSRIGACFTVTYDDELIISKTWEDSPNPYNFQVGDELVGFNGISWEEWIPEIENAGIPIYGSAAASKTAIRYNLLRSAMANINLFEKINIKRIDTGEIETMDIVYINSPALDDPSVKLITCTELTETPGLVDIKTGEPLSWKDDSNFVYGVIENKNIGYMYIKSSPHGFDEINIGGSWNPYDTKFSKIFEQAVIDLMDTDGLIMDLRYNPGGRNEPFYIG